MDKNSFLDHVVKVIKAELPYEISEFEDLVTDLLESEITEELEAKGEEVINLPMITYNLPEDINEAIAQVEKHDKDCTLHSMLLLIKWLIDKKSRE